MAEVTPLTLDDYDAIADAVQETERGRWFLAEFARRNRAADTALVLDALAGLERRLSLQGPASSTVVGLIHEALDRALHARAATPEQASERFDALERTLRRAAEALGSPAPERGVVVSVEEVLIAPDSGATVPLALAAPIAAKMDLVVEADALEEPRIAADVVPAAGDEPIAAPSIAYDETEEEPQPSSAIAEPVAIEPVPTVPSPAMERATPALAPGRPSLLLDSLSAAEKAILFA